MSVLSSKKPGSVAGLWYDARTVPCGTWQQRSCSALQRSGVDLALLSERFTALEIEAKFRVVNRALFASLRELTTLGHFLLVHTPGTERQHNTYFDTADRRLAAARTSV